jgi:hypothetical protein
MNNNRWAEIAARYYTLPHMEVAVLQLNVNFNDTTGIFPFRAKNGVVIYNHMISGMNVGIAWKHDTLELFFDSMALGSRAFTGEFIRLDGIELIVDAINEFNEVFNVNGNTEPDYEEKVKKHLDFWNTQNPAKFGIVGSVR